MSGAHTQVTDLRNETDLKELAQRAAVELEDAGALDLLRWTDENFGGTYVVASNMQDAVLVDLATKVRSGVDVLFLDTGYHFVETVGTRDAVEAVYDINVVNVAPENSVAKQDELFGKDLFAREPNECCAMRKVAPLGKALRNYSAWVTGIRRVESPTRANAPLISWDSAFGLVKINPIATWSDEEMQHYIEVNDILVNPLVFEGYPSIGCAPCTTKPAEGADPRSGRWAGSSKTECGLHAS
ncbi:MAG: phosphoadenylyl-sulfate reductase [Mycobacterium sp.]